MMPAPVGAAAAIADNAQDALDAAAAPNNGFQPGMLVNLQHVQQQAQAAAQQAMMLAEQAHQQLQAAIAQQLQQQQELLAAAPGGLAAPFPAVGAFQPGGFAGLGGVQIQAPQAAAAAGGEGAGGVAAAGDGQQLPGWVQLALEPMDEAADEDIP
jgi:hypothetical protein